VTVAYNFEKPVRHHRDLYVPAYKTKGGGVVVVDVWLDRNGTVTKASIQSSTNSELNASALAAARHRKTLFRIDDTAPESHRGTITYTFVAQ
jgi:TonB family protein